MSPTIPFETCADPVFQAHLRNSPVHWQGDLGTQTWLKAFYDFGHNDGSGVAAPPTLSSISPLSAKVGSADTTLTLTGTSFVSGAVVFTRISTEVDLATTFVSATSLTAVFPATRMTVVRNNPIYVRNPDGQVSLAKSFNVTAF